MKCCATTLRATMASTGRAAQCTSRGLARSTRTSSCRSPRWSATSSTMCRNLRGPSGRGSLHAHWQPRGILTPRPPFWMFRGWYVNGSCTMPADLLLPVRLLLIVFLQFVCSMQGFKNFSRTARELVHRMQKIDSDYYPETLHQMFVVNAGSGFKLIWNSVKGFLDPKTSSKIHVLGSNYQSRLLEVIDPSELPDFLGGSCTCSDRGGCLGSNKGPWNDPFILKLIHNLEAGCVREIKAVSDGEERSSSSLRSEWFKWQGMINDISNAESGSDVDDFGSFFQKGADYDGYLTPVHEEVRGTYSSTYYSCEDQTSRDIAPESCRGVQQTTDIAQKQLADIRQPSTNRNHHDSGNNAFNLDGAIARRGFENIVKAVVTAFIKLLSFLRLFFSKPVRRLENVPSTVPVPAEEKPQPRSTSDDGMAACLQRLDNLESLCNHLISRPPEIPEEKDHMLLNSFQRIKCIEADLERTKRVLHETVAKQKTLVDTLEAVQESSRVRKRLFCS
ncbi:hypothetical protein GUJ93_ZPchr0008g13574 [Zizania palustris]|uniref:CRAL-TRIO domain-containing protein n=1 Tax=Zizania palustris TaxID=103762 RepID=A0A8J5REG2_ZIZPA|nr:hypothetical protein GUJ93_ZPchr0008g13574 [Zizania palustris]